MKKSFIKIIAVSALSFAPVGAFAFLGSPTIDIQSVSQPVETGGLVPVNVLVKGFSSSDPLKSIELEVLTNPEPHQKIFNIDFEEDQTELRISTRARFSSAESGGLIRATAITRSGKKHSSEFKTGKIGSPVDFSNQDTLAVAFNNPRPTPFDFKTKEIFETNLMVIENGDSKKVGSNIQHPALPSSLGSGEKVILSVEAVSSGSRIYQVVFGNAVSNDPFLILDFKSANSISSLKYVIKHQAGQVEKVAKPVK